jgi:hypothetical protein
MTLATSHWAGGMLAPWCEPETSEPVIGRSASARSIVWREHFSQNPVQRFAGSWRMRATAPISNVLQS